MCGEHGEADNLAGVKIHNRRQVNQSSPVGKAGKIRSPDLAGPDRKRNLLQEIRVLGRIVRIWLSCALSGSATIGFETKAAHDPPDSFPVYAEGDPKPSGTIAGPLMQQLFNPDL